VIKPEQLDKMRAARKGLPQAPDVADKSRDNLAKAKAIWSGMKHSGEAKRKMREAKSTLIAIYYPDGRTVVERMTYRDMAERVGDISHSALAEAARRGRMISKKGALQGCYIWNWSQPTPPNLAAAMNARISKLEGNGNGRAA